MNGNQKQVAFFLDRRAPKTGGAFCPVLSRARSASKGRRRWSKKIEKILA
jgi:hypothetical protein